tara:strand:- start:126 stop:965 length:840 start_codon:yes stop_codon:yes gene_type:complete
MKLNLKDKIKIPDQIIDEREIFTFFKEVINNEKFFDLLRKEFSRVENKEINPNSMKEPKPYKPQIRDLYRLYSFILLNKRTTVLELGSGWSTLFIKIALDNLKKKYQDELKELRRADPFKLFTVDNEKKFLAHTKKRMVHFFKDKKLENIKFCYSDCNVGIYQGKYCIEYSNFPICNPDFIYIDGPDIFNIKGKVNNFSYGHQDIMPIVADILRIEYFLIPGTIILIDGRSANAQFLNDFLKRKWIYNFDITNDQHIFFLDSPSLGKLNDKLIKFYANN